MTATERKDRAIAATATLIIVVMCAWIVASVYLHYTPPAERTWPPVDESAILLPEDIADIMPVTATPSDALSPAPREARAEEGYSQGADPVPHDPMDDVNAGPASAVPTPPISSEQESPVKVTPVPENVTTGPSKEELEQQRKEREQQARSQQRNSAMKNAFGKSHSTPNATAGGDSDGKAPVGIKHGQPNYRLSGRTMSGWGTAQVTAPSGTVVVEVRVNRQGKVTEATYKSGTGVAASMVAVRNDCVRRAKTSSFSVNNNAPAEQIGTITYSFTTAH